MVSSRAQALIFHASDHSGKMVGKHILDDVTASLSYLIPEMPPDFLLCKTINRLLFKKLLVRFAIIAA